jgi:hypothetical protein
MGACAISVRLVANNLDLGRHVFGLAVLYFGLLDFVFHDYNDWEQLRSLAHAPDGYVLLYAVAACMVAGGLAIQWRKTVRAGAGLLALVFLFFALRWLPGIVAHPQVFGKFGNLFEQLSLVSGATIVFATSAPRLPLSGAVARAAYVTFGLCVISFTLEQALYLSATASFVPKWIPPGQMFWAVLTTVAFALAAIALLSGVQARTASRLLTAMIVAFGLLVWLPMLLTDPASHLNWAGNAQNMAIAGASWIVADYLSGGGRRTQPA